MPTCVVVTTPFIQTAELTAKMAGMPGYPYVAVIPHPISRLGAPELQLRALAVADTVAMMLLATPAG